MAARKTTTRTLRVLRTVLLVALVGFLALVYGLYRFGRAGLPEGESTAASSDAGAADGTAVMAAEGFDYSIIDGETTLARIRAHRVVSQSDDEVTLERLDPVEVYRDGGDLYRVTSDAGTYNFDSQATTLTGSVVLQGPRGLELRADALTMGRARQVVTSRGAVSFSMAGEFVGSARRLTADLERDRFGLSGNVEIFNASPKREPIRLTCNRLTLDRDAGLLRAEGNVVFRRGRSSLRARRMVFHLTEEEDAVRYISGRWGLQAELVKALGPRLSRTTIVRSDEFYLLVDPASGEPVEAELQSRPGGLAALMTTDETGLSRALAAPTIRGTFRQGELRRAEASEPAQMREFFDFAARHTLRWACGQRAVVEMDADGEIQHALLEERVEFREGRNLAKGDRVEMRSAPYTVEMTGQPARMIGVQGELAAPRIIQEGEEGDIRAVDGVRGRFDSAGGRSSISLGGAKGPIRVESAEARWNQETPSFKFERQVRLWQDENLLLAEEVETLTEEDLVVARGGVRTLLVPQEESTESSATPAEEGSGDPEPATGTPDQADEDSEPAEAVDGGPVEILSKWMAYRTVDRIITYHGGVLIRQTGRRMSCQTAEATLLEGGGLETLHCVGQARVEDAVAGRTVTGDDALYRVGAGQITFRGNPVLMVGDQGERIEGATLVYDLGSGAARVERSTESPPSPAADESDDRDADTERTDGG